ncbi:MAG: hypothetical protein HY820_34270 [Acidobacteria bacterium]|nr:hypothetical protein [Acidobacteriota bacterium]
MPSGVADDQVLENAAEMDVADIEGEPFLWHVLCAHSDGHSVAGACSAGRDLTLLLCPPTREGNRTQLTIDHVGTLFVPVDCAHGAHADLVRVVVAEVAAGQLRHGDVLPGERSAVTFDFEPVVALRSGKRKAGEQGKRRQPRELRGVRKHG